MGHMVKPPVILEIIVRIKQLELKHSNREVGIRRFQAGMFVSAHPQLSLSSNKCGIKLSEAFRGERGNAYIGKLWLNKTSWGCNYIC